jgi:hypothetical protein
MRREDEEDTTQYWSVSTTTPQIGLGTAQSRGSVGLRAMGEQDVARPRPGCCAATDIVGCGSSVAAT